MTEKIIATCGHEIPEIDEKYNVIRYQVNRYGGMEESHEVICLDCQEKENEFACCVCSKPTGIPGNGVCEDCGGYPVMDISEVIG